MKNEIDHAAVTELKLTIENDSRVYPMRQAIEKTLRSKVSAGRYDASKAPKAWVHFVEAGAKLYRKDFPGVRFNRITLAAVAVELAREFEAEVTTELQAAKLEAIAAQNAAKRALAEADRAAIDAINVQAAFNFAIKGA